MPNRHDRRVAGKHAPKKPVEREVNVRDTNIVFPPDIKAVFSDGLLMQYSGEAIVLSFLKQMPDARRALSSADVENRCVSQIAITPRQLAENLKMLNMQFRKFADAQDDEVKNFLLDAAGIRVAK